MTENKQAKIDVLKKKVEDRKEVLKKHIADGKPADGDVIRRDRKLFKRASTKLFKTISGGKKKKSD